MRLERGVTADNATVLFSHQSIKKLSRDGHPFRMVDHHNVVYYSAFIGDSFVGAFMVIRNTDMDSDIHLLLLPTSVKYYRDLCVLAIDEVFLTAHRVTAKIYGHLKTIQNLVKKLGFTHEGTMREVCIVDGKITDIEIYGLIKTDWRLL